MSMNTSIITKDFLTGLSNKDLVKELKKIAEAMQANAKSAWTVAEGFTNIVCNELFADDYDTEKEFASDMGVSKGYLSQCKNAVLFADKHDKERRLTVGKCYRLSVLSDEDFIDFSTWCADNNLDIYYMSDKGLINMIKTWKEGLIEEIEEEAEEIEEEAEEIEEEAEEIEEEAEEIEIAHITYNGRTYLIPVNVLEQYEA